MNARRNAEMALFPAAIFDLMRAAAPVVGECTDREMTDFNHVRDGCKAAMDNTLLGLTDKEKRKHMRRVDSLVQDMARIWNGNEIAKTLMAFFYILKDLTDHEYLNLHEGSPFADAMTTLLSALESWFDKSKLDRSAQKQARKILALLMNERGLFSGFKGDLT
jgi:hypothetical protein